MLGKDNLNDIKQTLYVWASDAKNDRGEKIPMSAVDEVLDSHTDGNYDFLTLDKSEEEKEIDIRFRAGRETRNMNAGLLDGSDIKVNIGFLKELIVAYGGPNYGKVDDAYRQMLGHEMGHKDKFARNLVLYSPIDSERFKITKDTRFVAYTNEIYADIYGCKAAFGDDAERARGAMKYLEDTANDDNKRDTQLHPSRQARRIFACGWEAGDLEELKDVKGGCFNSEVIERIAEYAGCGNRGLVESVKRKYNEAAYGKENVDGKENVETKKKHKRKGMGR